MNNQMSEGKGLDTLRAATRVLNLVSCRDEVYSSVTAPSDLNAQIVLHEESSSKVMLSTPVEHVPVDKGSVSFQLQEHPPIDPPEGSTPEHQLLRASETPERCSHVDTPLRSSLELLFTGLDQDIHQALGKLQEAQKAEYTLASKRLSAQKEYILSLYEQLDAARSELASHLSSSSMETSDALMGRISDIFQELQKERSNFQAMLDIRSGFGQTSESTLTELFGLSKD